MSSWIRDNKRLIQAAKEGDSFRVQELLINGNVNTTYRTKYGRTALHFTCEHGYADIARLLIELGGADVNAKEGNYMNATPLYRACACGRLETVRILVEYGADVHTRDNNKKTLLHIACEKGHLDIAKLLLENDCGADVNAKDKIGMTPLHVACHNGKFDVLQLLLGRGADANMKTILGSTPLQVASKRNHTELVWFLVRQNPWLVL